MPKVTLEKYAEVVISLFNICEIEKENNPKKYKQLHSWYLYRQSFYGFLDHMPAKNNFISQRAKEKYSEDNKDSLREKTWIEQPEFDSQRKIFHLEHIYTGVMFRNAMKNMKDSERTVETVTDLIKSNYRSAWILKEEDKLLPKSYRGNDLNDALRSYVCAGITLI